MWVIQSAQLSVLLQWRCWGKFLRHWCLCGFAANQGCMSALHHRHGVSVALVNWDSALLMTLGVTIFLGVSDAHIFLFIRGKKKTNSKSQKAKVDLAKKSWWAEKDGKWILLSCFKFHLISREVLFWACNSAVNFHSKTVNFKETQTFMAPIFCGQTPMTPKKQDISDIVL